MNGLSPPKGIVLLGCEESKRTKYFFTAASRLGIKAAFCDIRRIDDTLLKNKLVKIDPITYESSEIKDIDLHAAQYTEQLAALRHVEGIQFLNTPEAIHQALSKRVCKAFLQAHGIHTTEALTDMPSSYDALKDTLDRQKIYQVFIKPNYGAGAAGVAAYRFHPRLKKEALYTSVHIAGGTLINTKKVIKYEASIDIRKIINTLLKGEVIIERWTPKAQHKGLSYDLRVVVQFGRVDFIVGRLSGHPITNLHLNNQAIAVNDLEISPVKLAEAKELCLKAVSVCKGLRVAGIDLLLTKDKLTPMIIEMNAQGDLIYQDLYDQNIIYTNQLLEMRNFIENGSTSHKIK